MGIAVIPAPGGGVTQKVQDFTSTGTFTAPANCSSVQVLLVGGGGGGGWASNSNTNNPKGGGGAAGGEVITQTLAVTPGTSYTVTIGAGGAGATNLSNGGTGGTSSFGSLLSAFGGNGGSSVESATGATVALRGSGQALRGTDNGAGGAGGGAGGPAQLFSVQNPAQNNDWVTTSPNNTNQRRVGGGVGVLASSNTTRYIYIAGIGKDGFGSGGAGGFFGWSSSAGNAAIRVEWSGTGAPTFSDLDLSTRSNGAAASANTGDGGHGGTTIANVQNTPGSGWNGGSGFCRVIFWS